MLDQFHRTIDYLRISVTDRCNFRCRYCMPPEGVADKGHTAILTLEEILEVTAAAAELGVRKVRITGGEPLVRRGVIGLCEKIAALPGVAEVAMTTNGVLLADSAAALRAAGVRRVNVSLDTLDAEKFHRMTCLGALEDTLRGIEAAQAAGLGVKLNTVLIGGFNDDEIESLIRWAAARALPIRFIELMPMTGAFGAEAYLPCDTVLRHMPALHPFATHQPGTVARLYEGEGAQVGLISPLSCDFCGECNRLRLTADGYLKPCLHARGELSVRGRHGAALREQILAAAAAKPARHAALSSESPSAAGRFMNEIGG